MNRRSDEYLEYIREQNCIVCGTHPVDPHHLKSRGSGGDDYTCVPLCRTCHSVYHSDGLTRFQEKFNVNVYQDAMMYLIRFLRSVQSEEDR